MRSGQAGIAAEWLNSLTRRMGQRLKRARKNQSMWANRKGAHP
jgi:hypothetical protein